MAPPWPHTLASFPRKFLCFATNSCQKSFPSIVLERTICVSSSTQRNVKHVKFQRPHILFSSTSKPCPLIVVRNPVYLQKCSYCVASTNMTPEDVKKEMGLISDKFGEALELLNDARSSAGTVYFSEDMKDAEVMVEDTLNHYKTLLAKLEAEARLDVQRSIGLKMEELKAQFQMIKDEIRD